MSSDYPNSPIETECTLWNIECYSTYKYCVYEYFEENETVCKYKKIKEIDNE